MLVVEVIAIFDALEFSDVICQIISASISGFCGHAYDLLSSVINVPISYPECLEPFGRVFVHLMIISQFFAKHFSLALFSILL